MNASESTNVRISGTRLMEFVGQTGPADPMGENDFAKKLAGIKKHNKTK